MTPDEYLGRVRALLPVLRERAPRTEQLRRLPDETFADFQEQGLLRALQPKRYGGYELDPGIFYQAVTEVAAVCGSSGWIFGVLGVHNWHLAILPPQAQEDVWGKDDSVQLSTSIAPTGKVERVAGGFRLSGRWSTGIHVGSNRTRCRLGIADATEERLHRGEIDRDNVGRDFAMRLAVHPLGSCGVGRVDQAEIGTALLVEPVGHVLDPVSVLDFEILAMRLSDAFGGQAVHVVTIHEDRHGGLHLPVALEGQALIGCCGSRWASPRSHRRRKGRGGRGSAAASPLGAVDHSTTRVGLRATGRDKL